jgi:hypothetical protein
VNFENWFAARIRHNHHVHIPNEYYFATTGFFKFVYFLDLSTCYSYQDYDKKLPTQYIQELNPYVCSAMYAKFDKFFGLVSKQCAVEMIYTMKPIM